MQAKNKAGGLAFIHSLKVHFLLLSLQFDFEILVIMIRDMSIIVISSISTIFETNKMGSSVEPVMIFISCYSFLSNPFFSFVLI